MTFVLDFRKKNSGHRFMKKDVKKKKISLDTRYV